MAKITYPANAPVFTVTPEYHGDIVFFGNAASNDTVGAIVVQFSPSLEFSGSFAVVAQMRYQTQETDGTPTPSPYIPIAYIPVNVDGAAGDRNLTDALITGTGIIEIPANGLNVGLLVACTAGTCTLNIATLAGTPFGFATPEEV